MELERGVFSAELVKARSWSSGRWVVQSDPQSPWGLTATLLPPALGFLLHGGWEGVLPHLACTAILLGVS